jgi:hypothetical protein
MDGVSVSVVLGEESEPKPIANKPKKKKGRGRYLFEANSNMNAEDKIVSAKMSSKEYYHECKFNWNKSKQKKCYARCP